MQRNPEFPGQGKLSLPPDRYLHLWYVKLDDSGSTSADVGILTRIEHERAERFRIQAARARFVAARSSLRCLLSAYLDLPGGEIPLEISTEGKPRLGGGLANVLTFNLSHSGDWILLGFASGTEVGVDLEAVSSFQDVLEVAGRVLTVGEVESLRKLSPAEQVSAFFRGWTRKEALQKARGVGIWNDPARVAAGLGSPSGEPSAMTVPDGEYSCAWTIQGVPAPEGYSAAAAMKGETFRTEILLPPTEF